MRCVACHCKGQTIGIEESRTQATLGSDIETSRTVGVCSMYRDGVRGELRLRVAATDSYSPDRGRPDSDYGSLRGCDTENEQ